MRNRGGLSDSQLIGAYGEEDVNALLLETFERAEVSKETPDYGTDFFCKIPSSTVNFYTVEWRIQVKATKGRASRIQLTTRRAELILGSPQTNWLLFLVKYDDDILTRSHGNAAQRRNAATIFVVNIARALSRLLKSEPKILDERDEVSIEVSDDNLATTNMLVHLWSACLWSQISAAFYGGLSQENAEACAPLISDVRKIDSTMATLSSHGSKRVGSIPDVNVIIDNLSPELRRPLLVPLHSYYGARVVIAENLKRPRAAKEIRAFSRIDRLDHVLCWIFSFWYPHYNRIASLAGGAENFVRILELGQICASLLHERILAWQMLKSQIRQGVRVVLIRRSELDGLESRTMFWPYSVSSTRLYAGSEHVETYFGRPVRRMDEFDWKRLVKEGLQLQSAADLYGMECLEVFNLARMSPSDLQGRGVPKDLLPCWWRSVPNALPIVMS